MMLSLSCEIAALILIDRSPTERHGVPCARLNFFRPLRQYALLICASFLLTGCVVPPQTTPAAPLPAEVARLQRVERAQSNLVEGLRLYEAGTYEESLKNLLIALDSGVLTVPQQLNARKHLAFIQCVKNRELICKEEFEKAFALDPNFELTPAEVGHPTWGPIFRLVKTELDLKKSGKSLPPAAAPKVLTPAEKMIAEATRAYDDADYTKAIKLFHDAIKESPPIGDKIKAHKFIAFSYCLSNRMSLCRAEFEKLLTIDPTYELEAAEAGHPSWGPSFRAVNAKLKAVSPPPAKK